MDTSDLNLDLILENLIKLKLPSEDEISKILSKSYNLLNNLPNIAELKPPLIIVGNIHSQFKDLLEIFKIGGDIPEIDYLFLGNYVHYSISFYGIETFLYLLVLKIKYPNHITLLRGNHETINALYLNGFYGECRKKFKDLNIFHKFLDIFNVLQLSAIIKSENKNIFCVHGGLSPKINSFEDINKLNRKQNINPESVISDLLWNEPCDSGGFVNDFCPQSHGGGYLFGKNPVDKFCKDNNIDLIITGNYYSIDEGFLYFFENKLVIIWSAPNYLNRFGNKGCIIELDEHMNINLKIFLENSSMNINNDLDDIDQK